jgi:hypothetical protein
MSMNQTGLKNKEEIFNQIQIQFNRVSIELANLKQMINVLKENV